MSLEYQDFYIHVGWPNERGSYPVELIHSPRGETRQPVWQENRLALPAYQHILDYLAELVAAPEQVEQLGVSLHEFLFPPEIYEIYKRCREDQGGGLRIRLRVDPEELSLLPWEYCYDIKIRQFLALERQTPIVRYIAEEFAAPTTLAMPRPVRVLAVLAAPKDQPALDLEREQAGLRQALKNVQVELNFLSHASIDKLHESLLDVEPHIVHFSGHGVLSGGQGALALENPITGNTDPLTARQMRSLLNRMGITLAVLNACETARHSTRDALMGVAQALIREEIPAVIAMQFLVSESVSLIFTRRLYEFLFRGDSLEKIITETRVGIHINTEQDQISWGIPVLFMRARDGHLWMPESSLSRGSLDSLITSDLQTHSFAAHLPSVSTASILLKKVYRHWVVDVLAKAIPNQERRIDFHFQRNIDGAGLPGNAISGLFEDFDHAFLLLGAPGSGKTIAMCELARDLILTANRDQAFPLPVVLRLATWRHGSTQDLKRWIDQELKTQYGLGQTHIGEIKPRGLILLLESLDEVRPEDQASCVKSINEYCAGEGWVNIVITCRESDYADLAEAGHSLSIPGKQVINIMPLDERRITTFLSGLDLAGVDVRQLGPLLTNEGCPLMADVILQTFADQPEEKLTTVKVSDIWGKFVDRKFEDEYARLSLSRLAPPFSREKTHQGLNWLAQQLEVHTQDKHRFFLEEIQPNWLSKPGRVLSYLLIYAILIGSAYLLTGSMMKAGVPILYGEIGVSKFLGNFLNITIPLASIWIAVVIWTIARRSSSYVGPILVGLITWATFGTMVWIPYSDRPMLALVGGGATAIIAAILTRLIIKILGFSEKPIACVKRRHWNWSKAGAGFMIGIAFVLMISFVSDITRAMFFEGMGFYAAVKTIFTFNSVVWWNWALPGLVSMSLFFPLVLGLGWGEVVLREEVDSPNQGIKDSGRTGLIIFASGLAAGFIYIFAIGLPCYLGIGWKLNTGNCSQGDWAGLWSGFGFGLSFGLLIGFIFGMIFGGFAWLRYYFVRLQLSLGHEHTPLQLVKFLQYGAKLGFLRSVGGGFEFIDQELELYFSRPAPRS